MNLDRQSATTNSRPVMPSKAQQAAAADDMFAVEELVHEIKENLRLKAPPTNSVLHHRSLRRPSPYSVPSRSYVATPRSGLLNACDDPNYGGDSSLVTGTGGVISSSSGPGAHAAGAAGGGGSVVTMTATTTTVSAKVHCHHRHHRNRNKATEDIDDPYEMLQSLLKNNSLVKEAVRRLQLNLSPKQRYFYESDEESSRSPMMRMCQLEL